MSPVCQVWTRRVCRSMNWRSLDWSIHMSSCLSGCLLRNTRLLRKSVVRFDVVCTPLLQLFIVFSYCWRVRHFRVTLGVLCKVQASSLEREAPGLSVQPVITPCPTHFLQLCSWMSHDVLLQRWGEWGFEENALNTFSQNSTREPKSGTYTESDRKKWRVW